MGVGLDGGNLTHNHPLEFRPDLLYALNLQTCHGEEVGELGRGEFTIDIFF
jgi:hypothetical protein